MDSQQILSFYMGKNTPERKDYIMENLVGDGGGVTGRAGALARTQIIFNGEAQSVESWADF